MGTTLLSVNMVCGLAIMPVLVFIILLLLCVYCFRRGEEKILQENMNKP